MNGVGQYRESEVVTARGARLIVVAYDGALTFLYRARRAFEMGAPQEAPPQIFRAKRVVLYLLSTLDPSAGEVVSNLSRLYTYAIRRLAEAAIERDAAALDEAIKILSELRSAWNQVAESEAVAVTPEVDSALSLTG